MLNEEIKTEKIKKDRSIGLKSMCLRILLRWKIIIAVVLVGGVLAMGQNYLEQREQVKVAAHTDRHKDNTGGSYSNFYSKQKDNIKSALMDRYTYLNETLVQDINPYDASSAEITFYIGGAKNESSSSGSVVSEEKSDDNSEVKEDAEVVVVSNDAGVNTYLTGLKNFLNYGIDWSSLKKEFHVEKDIYLNELVENKISGNTMTVTTYYKNVKGAEKIRDCIKQQITEKFNVIRKETGLKRYSLIVLDEQSDRVIKADNFTWLKDRLLEIKDLVDVSENMGSYSDQASLVADSVGIHNVSKSVVVKSSVKGGAVGLVIILLVLFCYLLLSGKVLSAKDFNGYYETENLYILPRRYRGKYLRGINRAVAKLVSEDKSTLPENERIKLVAEMISDLSEAKQVSVISDIKSENLLKVTEKLNEFATDISFYELFDVQNSLIERKKLAESDAVIIVAEIEKSRYSAMNQVFDLVNLYKIPVLGTITI